MVFLLSLHILYLLLNGIVVCRSLNIADDTKCYWESVLVVHHRKFQLQSVVLTVGIVNEYILLCDSVLTDFHYLQSESFLHESVFVVLTKDEGLSVLYVDGVLLTSLLIIYWVVATIIEDNAVLQDLAYGSTLVLIGSLQDFHCLGSVGSHRAGEEVSACTEAKLCRAEGILNCSVGT